MQQWVIYSTASYDSGSLKKKDLFSNALLKSCYTRNKENFQSTLPKYY